MYTGAAFTKNVIRMNVALCKNVMLFVRLSVGFAYVSHNTLSVHEVKTDIKTIKEVNRVLVYKQNMLHVKHLL